MITIAYLVVAMWTAFVTGGIVGTELKSPPMGEITVYKISIDENGERKNICKEEKGVILKDDVLSSW